MKKEIWKDIAGYEGIYSVSNFGRVKRLRFTNNHFDFEREKIMTPCKKDNKYLYVCLFYGGVRKNKYIHRLVADAFVPNPEGKPVVNHKDFDATNNNAENLEWSTQKENVDYSAFHMSKPKINAKVPVSTGEKYIRKRGGHYEVCIRAKNKPIVRKSFRCLTDAISFRESALRGVG